MPACLGVFCENQLGVVEGLYHPDVHHLLLSVGKLEERGYKIVFDGANSIMVHNDGRRISINRSDNGLPVCVVRFDADFKGEKSVREMQQETANVHLSAAEKLLQHHRFGHFHRFDLGSVDGPEGRHRLHCAYRFVDKLYTRSTFARSTHQYRVGIGI